MLNRRAFVTSTTLSLAAAAWIKPLEAAVNAQEKPDWSWPDIRSQFALAPGYIHLGLFYLASHPRPVRESIEHYRRMLDDNPVLTVEHSLFFPEFGKVPGLVRKAIGNYIGATPDDIALAGSTTDGLALIYQGLPLEAGDELLTTSHDHFSHHESIRLAAERAGASWRKIPLFDSYATISEDQIVDRIREAVRPNTRAVGVTWVHSSSGLKLPLRKIAAALAPLNASRNPEERVVLVVDGVHGIGVEDPTEVTAADFFSAGLHKWILGPRGTAFVWAPADRWAMLRPTIPTFEAPELYEAWMAEERPKTPPRAAWFSPGGFHAFEHYWAVPAAIEIHRKIGPARVTGRIHTLNAQMKEGLAKMPNVTLYTSRAEKLSAGIVCFDVKGLQPQDVVNKLHDKKIIATTTPYRNSYARVAAGLYNTPEEVDTTLRAIRALS